MTQIRFKTDNDIKLVRSIMSERWGGEPLIIHAKKYYPTQLPGLLAFREDGPYVGFLSYEIQNNNTAEIFAFEVLDQYQGTGTQMLEHVYDELRKNNVTKVIVMTTNDNIDALRFYQKRGFVLTGINTGIVFRSRHMKESIGELGDYDIPLRDELLMERNL